jgi:hypothetical protein
MRSESFAGILGAAVAAAVLLVAFAYGPVGQFGRSAKPAKMEQSAQPTQMAPPVRGPVVKEVPN